MSIGESSQRPLKRQCKSRLPVSDCQLHGNIQSNTEEIDHGTDNRNEVLVDG